MIVSNLHIPSSAAPILPDGDRTSPKTSEKLPCRDPYILYRDDAEGGHYYLYRSAGKDGVCCLVSPDLENWSAPVTVFAVPEHFHGVKNFFWAPECHYFGGYFYLFTSVFSSLTNHRSISVYRSASPLGPFEDIAGGCITPRDWDCIDGTLFVDGKGEPWMVFVHEWTSMPDHNGSMCAAKLADDLTHFVTEPRTLFYAREPAWAAAGVTDGPYLIRDDAGTLFMIWSNFCAEGYTVALAKSSDGMLFGKWEHAPEPIFKKGLKPGFDTEGGHAMIFVTREGKPMITFHGPNRATPDGDFEHVLLHELKIGGGTIEVL